MAIAGDGRSNIVHENSLHDADAFDGEAARHFVEGAGEFRQFEAVLTNPPFGTKTKVLAIDDASFMLGSKWRHKKDGWERAFDLVDRDPYVLFVERCLGLLVDGGTLAIILPETVFHAPSLGYVRQFLLTGNNVRAVIDLPHNTFRPHCNAKTCLLVMRKGEAQQDRVVMATPQEMGHDHTGRALYRPGTEELWDDLAKVLEELDDPDDPENEHVFSVPWANVFPDILVPRFYRGRIDTPKMPDGCYGVSLGDLIEGGIVEAWDSHGSPESQAKGDDPLYSGVRHRELGALPEPGLRHTERRIRAHLGRWKGAAREGRDFRAAWQLSDRDGRDGVVARPSRSPDAGALDLACPPKGEPDTAHPVLPARHAVIFRRAEADREPCVRRYDPAQHRRPLETSRLAVSRGPGARRGNQRRHGKRDPGEVVSAG